MATSTPESRHMEAIEKNREYMVSLSKTHENFLASRAELPEGQDVTTSDMQQVTINDGVIDSNFNKMNELLEAHEAINSEDGITEEELALGNSLLAQHKELLDSSNILINANNEILGIDTSAQTNTVSAPAVDPKAQQSSEAELKFIHFMSELTGMDVSTSGSAPNIFEMFDAIMKMSEPGAMEKVMAKMKDAVGNLKTQNPSATSEEKLEAAEGAASEVINEMKQEQENAPAEEKVGLGGVNGTAFTTIVDKKPDNIIEGSAIKPAIQEGDPLITSTFNVNVNAVGTMVDATVDNDASSQINFDITKPAANNDQFSMTA